MPISKEQARELGRAFLDVAHALGAYRFDQWSDLTAVDRKRIEDGEWDLLTYSSTLTTKAVGMELDDLKGDLAVIVRGAAKATKRIGTVRDVKVVLKVAAAFVTLGGAIASGNAAAIASSASSALAAVVPTGALKAARRSVPLAR